MFYTIKHTQCLRLLMKLGMHEFSNLNLNPHAHPETLYSKHDLTLKLSYCNLTLSLQSHIKVEFEDFGVYIA